VWFVGYDFGTEAGRSTSHQHRSPLGAEPNYSPSVKIKGPQGKCSLGAAAAARRDGGSAGRMTIHRRNFLTIGCGTFDWDCCGSHSKSYGHDGFTSILSGRAHLAYAALLAGHYRSTPPSTATGVV